MVQAFPTDVGLAKLANAEASGTKVVITEFAVGTDGTAHTGASTTLGAEVYRASVSSLTVDPDDATVTVVETVTPASESGFVIRELGLLDADGDLIVIANTPELDKTDGSAPIDMVLNIRLAFNRASSVAVNVNPGAFATVAYVDDAVLTPLERDFIHGGLF